MVLAAKEDRMPDCVTRPEPVWADTPEPEPVEEEDGNKDDEPFIVPDPTFEEGEQGTLIPEETFGPAKPKKEKPAKPDKVKKPKENKGTGIRWIKDIGSKFKTGVLTFYDEMTREEEDETNPKAEE
jgi:hypothetical protein